MSRADANIVVVPRTKPNAAPNTLAPAIMRMKTKEIPAIDGLMVRSAAPHAVRTPIMARALTSIPSELSCETTTANTTGRIAAKRNGVRVS